MTNVLRVRDEGTTLDFTFEELLRYHGPDAPGGVAHAFKVMERAFPLLADDAIPDRRRIVIETPFPGPGARDAFEAVTRAVTGGRYVVDPDLAQPALGADRARFIFRVRAGAKSVTLALRPGHIREEFLALAGNPVRTAEENARFAELKREMANRLMGLTADAIYDVED